ncbi:hypothetical protein Hdeb2414_s0037g00733471 [Helianthus debilis subsp. tardiflorus]
MFMLCLCFDLIRLMEVGSIGFGVRFDMGPVDEFLEMVLSLRIRFFSIVVSLFKLKGM